MSRPPVERYARTTFTTAGITIEPGIQYELLENVVELGRRLREIAAEAAAHRMALGAYAIDSVAIAVERAVAATWPERAFFVEVYDADGNWIQIFQPYGLPRNEVP